MSLQLWLPLNGQMTNQGLSTISGSGGDTTTFITNGKLGKAKNLQYPNWFTVDNLVGAKQFSVAFWIYGASSSTITSDWNKCLMLGDANASRNGSGLRFESCYSYDSRACSFHNNGYHCIVSYSDSMLVWNKDEWHHVCCTYSGDKFVSYVDGVKKSEYTGNGGWLTGVITIGNANYAGYMNDLRIYDEVISPKEIKEIAKGLVCHYKLSGVGGKNLLTGSLKNITSSSYGFGQCYIGKTLKDSTTYTFTVNGRTNDDKTSADGKYLRVYVYPIDWSWNINVIIKETTDTTVSITFTTPSDISSKTVYCQSYYYPSESNSGVAPAGTATINWYKLEEGSKATPWCPNPSDALYSTLGFGDGIEYDCSGNGNHGTKVGDIAWSSDSARYSGSYGFNGTSHIKTGFSTTMSELTCSFWVKPNSQDGGYAIIASNYSDPTSGFWIAINCEGSGLWFYKNGGGYVSASGVTLADDMWYHACFTYSNGVGKWYLNGILWVTADISSRGTTIPFSNLSIGNTYTGSSWNTKFYGNISDFRIYATALSAEDIKALYNVSASVDKTGVLSAYEFVEEG